MNNTGKGLYMVKAIRIITRLRYHTKHEHGTTWFYSMCWANICYVQEVETYTRALLVFRLLQPPAGREVRNLSLNKAFFRDKFQFEVLYELIREGFT